MSVLKFEDIPPSSRLWLYGAERQLTGHEASELSQNMDRFMQEWTAHKRELKTAWSLQHNQFIMVAVDEQAMAASGCSIDALVRFLQEIEQRFRVDIVNTTARVFYMDDANRIRCVDRAAFKKLVQTEQVGPETRVFDNTIQSVGEFREGKWLRPMRASWHAQAFLAKTQQSA